MCEVSFQRALFRVIPVHCLHRENLPLQLHVIRIGTVDTANRSFDGRCDRLKQILPRCIIFLFPPNVIRIGILRLQPILRNRQ